MFIKWQGEYEDRECRLRWEDGNLSGDAVLMAVVVVFAIESEGFYIFHNPTGPYTTHDHLRNPYSTMVMVRELAPFMVNVADNLPGRDDGKLDTLLGRHLDSWHEYLQRGKRVQDPEK